MLAALLGTGCTAAGGLDANTVYQPDDAFLLIGVEPAKAEVAIVDGGVENNVFSASADVRIWGGSKWTYFDPPKDGFIIARAPKGRATLGTILVRLNGAGSTLYSPCNRPVNLIADALGLRSSTDGSIVFNVEPGRVLYITHVTYTPDKEGVLRSEYRSDLESARSFLKAHHPQLVDRLAQGGFKVLRASACGLN